MKRSPRLLTVLKALFVLTLAIGGMMSLAQPAHAAAAHPASYGDPHNCEALAQGANTGSPNYTPEPFDAYQVPGSSSFSFNNKNGGADHLVACQPEFWENNFNNAYWDGYGNPFQCVELIDRYDRLRWLETYTWGDASSDWDNHPSHFAKEGNGSNILYVGDIMVWTTGDHIAVITYINWSAGQATLLEQNFTYSGGYYDSKRIMYFNTVHADNSYWYSFTGAYTWYTQNGTAYNGSGPQPAGWLHSS